MLTKSVVLEIRSQPPPAATHTDWSQRVPVRQQALGWIDQKEIYWKEGGGNSEERKRERESEE